MTLEMNRRQAGHDTGRARVRVFTGALQRGVSLIEVLVTLLVLAIGLLGLSALQGVSLQAGQVAYLRTQATNLAYEVTDFARANRALVKVNGNVPNMGYWNTRAAALLPEGGVVTSVTGADNEVVTVTVRWLDDRDPDAPTSDRYAEFQFQTRI